MLARNAYSVPGILVSLEFDQVKETEAFLLGKTVPGKTVPGTKGKTVPEKRYRVPRGQVARLTRRRSRVGYESLESREGAVR